MESRVSSGGLLSLVEDYYSMSPIHPASCVHGGGTMGHPSEPHAQQTKSHSCGFSSSHCKANSVVQFLNPFATQTLQCLHSADTN